MWGVGWGWDWWAFGGCDGARGLGGRAESGLSGSDSLATPHSFGSSAAVLGLVLSSVNLEGPCFLRPNAVQMRQCSRGSQPAECPESDTTSERLSQDEITATQASGGRPLAGAAGVGQRGVVFRHSGGTGPLWEPPGLGPADEGADSAPTHAPRDRTRPFPLRGGCLKLQFAGSGETPLVLLHCLARLGLRCCGAVQERPGPGCRGDRSR